MKTLVQKNVSHSRGVQEKVQYTVVNNTQLMTNLSKTLYSDEIRAVIRELSTNAWDSHVDAGNTHLPFKVQLPNDAGRIFSIRDYGTGLSRQDVLQMYTKYGGSDKSNSNDFNGMFGLGSKSPFAYTNTFDTISYYNGRKYTFVNIKDKEGTPTIQLMREEDTDEPNGLEITLIGKGHDNWNWLDKAQDIYQHFPLHPSGIEKANEPPTSELSGDGWAIYDDLRSPKAVMGWVAYPINPNQLLEGLAEEKVTEIAKIKDVPSWYKYLKKPKQEEEKVVNIDKSSFVGNDRAFYRRLLGSIGLRLYFDIGEVSFDLGREKLRYSEETIKAVKNKLDKVGCDLYEVIQADIDALGSRMEAIIFVKNLKTTKYSDVFPALENRFRFTYKGVEILNTSSFRFSQAITRYYKNTDNRKTTISREYPSSIPVPTNLDGMPAIFLNDVKTGAMSRCRKYVREDNGAILLVDPGYLTDVVNALGCKRDFIKKVSTIDKPERVVRVTNGIPGYVFTQDKTKYSYACKDMYWTNEDIDLSQGGFYVHVNSYKYASTYNRTGTLYSTNGMQPPSKLLRILNDVSELTGKETPRVVGVTASKLDPFNSSSKWTNILDHMENLVREYAKNNNEAIFDTKKTVGISSHYDVDLFEMAMSTHLFDEFKKTKLYKLVESIDKEIDAQTTDTTDVNRVVQRVFDTYTISELGLTDTRKVIDNKDLQKRIDSILETYPMLDLVSYSHDMSRNKQIVLDYINLVESNLIEGVPNV